MVARPLHTWMKLLCRDEKDVIVDKLPLLSQIWMKLLCRGEKGDIVDVLELTNVSTNYIKGIYCALYNEYSAIDGVKYDKDHKKIFMCGNKCLELYSNVQLTDFNNLNKIVKRWNSISVFTTELITNVVGEAYELNTTNDPTKCNIQWEKIIKEYPIIKQYPNEYNINHPTKRFVVFMRIDYGDAIFQFDSLEFLNGIALVHGWMQNNPMWPIVKNSVSHSQPDYKIICVLDHWKVCKMHVIYEISQKNKDDLIYVFDCLSAYLSKDIVILIINQFFKCYDNECSTPCVENHCHIHQRQEKVLLKFEQCIVKQIELIN